MWSDYMWSSVGEVTKKPAFRTVNGVEDYIKNFKNPLEETQVSNGDIYYIRSLHDGKGSSSYRLNYFQIVSIVGERVFFKEIDYGLEAGDPPLSPDMSNSCYWIPFRSFYINDLILEETSQRFFTEHTLFNIRDLDERSTFSFDNPNAKKTEDQKEDYGDIFDDAEKFIAIFGYP